MKGLSLGLAPLNIHDVRKQKADLRAKAQTILDTAQKANRELSAAEKTQYDELTAEMRQLNETIEHHAALTLPSTPAVADAARIDCPELKEFILRGAGGVKTSSLGEGSGGTQFVVPGWEVASVTHAYPSVTPFESAGATIISTEDGQVIKLPILTAGTDVGTFSEHSGPDSATDANVFVASLEATKYAFLTKFSEELQQDASLFVETGLIPEGIKRVFNSISKAVTAALISSLTAANAVTGFTGDYLDALLTLERNIDETWQSPSNVFMMDRWSLNLFRNVRDLNDRPIFDVVNKTLLGYRVVLNPACHGKVIFGAWAPGCYIRKTPIVVQRLVELYSESGDIGIRFQQRADQAFFSDAATATQAPQPLFMLNVDVGS